MSAPVLSRMQVLRLSVPVMLAQAAIAATGVVDTAIMGLYGDKNDLAAVAVASVAFSFIYWGFGFLRMSTTGLVAQSIGANNHEAARAVLQRAVLLGAIFGSVLLLTLPWFKSLIFLPFSAEPRVTELAEAYFSARIWGAPALLMTFGVTGWLLGTGRTVALLLLQVVMNAINIVLDIWFVAGLDLGPAGIGAGTAIAEWVAAVFGLVLVFRALRPVPKLFDATALWALFSANRDILIRTLALLFAFAWFVRSGALMGTAQLAGNEVLLQFITVSAFVLDGFAFVAEKEIGEAYGARNRTRLIRSMRITTELALLFGAVISLLYYFGGYWVIERFVRDVEAREAALAFLPFCAIVPLLGVPAWQLDGFFLGSTQGKAMRNAGLVSTVGYVALDIVLRPQFGNAGVWSAFLCMYVLRAGALGAYLPALLKTMPGRRQRPPSLS